MIAMMLAGALVGVGAALVVAGLVAPAPDLGTAVRRLEASAGLPHELAGAAPIWGRIAQRIAETLRLDRHRADLLLVGSTTSRLVAEKAGYAVLGLVFPLLLSAMLLLVGLHPPAVGPPLLGLGLGAGLSFVPELDLARRARRARVQMRRTVCAYLELVALERAADAGAVEALERAAAIGSGRAFEHIQQALLRARLEGRTPWQQLAALADDLRVPELGDIADIMRLSGEDGAAVLPTLRARAASLRSHVLQAEVSEANEASERMSIPVALLAIVFMALLGFPAVSRILFG